MPVALKVPSVGESITEVEIGEWLKQEGAFAKQDEPIVILETEKATLELPAPVQGKVTQVLKKTGEKAAVGDVVGYMEESAEPAQQQSEQRQAVVDIKPDQDKSGKEKSAEAAAVKPRSEVRPSERCAHASSRAGRTGKACLRPQNHNSSCQHRAGRRGPADESDPAPYRGPTR